MSVLSNDLAKVELSLSAVASRESELAIVGLNQLNVRPHVERIEHRRHYEVHHEQPAPLAKQLG